MSIDGQQIKNKHLMGEKSAKSALPSSASLYIVFNQKQVNKSEDGTYRASKDKKMIVDSFQGAIDETVSVLPSTDEDDQDMFKLYGNLILETLAQENNSFCGTIKKAYLQETISKCNAILFLYDGKDTVYGFATLFFMLKKNSIYIDLICSSLKYKGGGHKMMTKIKEIGELLDIKSVELSSVTEALGFYVEKEKFECDDLCPLTYDVEKNKSSRPKAKPKNKSIKKKSKL